MNKRMLPIMVLGAGLVAASTGFAAPKQQQSNVKSDQVITPQNIDPGQYMNKSLGIMKIDPDTVAAQRTIPPQPESDGQTVPADSNKSVMGVSQTDANQMMRKVQSAQIPVDPDTSAAEAAAGSIKNPIINMSNESEQSSTPD